MARPTALAKMPFTPFRYALALGLIIAACAVAPAHGHGPDPMERAPAQPAAGAQVESIEGELREVVVEDRLAGTAIHYRWLVLGDHEAVRVKGAPVERLAEGSRVIVTGGRNGATFFVDGARLARAGRPAAPAKKSEAVEIEGVLQIVHIDYLDDDRSRFELEIHEADGSIRPLDLGIRPEALQPGMHVRAKGRITADGSMHPSVIAITAMPDGRGSARTREKASATNNVLVILIRFADSGAQPFTQAQVQATMAGGPGSGSVAEYFKEVSFSQQLLNVTVTPWLASASVAPANCDWRGIGSAARSAATTAGYTLSSYQNLVYVFPQMSACGWSGLAYIGASGVWSNGRNSLLVYGHELGHNFGLLHAGSLRCGTTVMTGPCTVSEYGDPFNVMGNQRPMHFSALQKAILGWIAPPTLPTHTSGSVTYVLSPVELGGGSTYGVEVPAATNRTYWLEYRQPIGFDAPLASYPNNGAQVRLASPLETLCGGCDAWSNDTQIVDMVPSTSTFTDATLLAGSSYTDSTYGITFNVLSATPSALTVQVVTGGATVTTTAVASSSNPATVGTNVSFTATVTGSSPTGTVAFRANGTTIGGCSGVSLAGSGNVRTAVCTTSALAAGTHGIVASYAGNSGNTASSSAPLTQSIVAVSGGGTNVALASNGGIATASSTLNASYPVASVNNNQRSGSGWGAGGGWNDATAGAFPDWVQIAFNGSKTIDRVVVYTLQDNWGAPIEPTDTLTFSQYGLRDFTVQGWNGSGWVTLASVSGNSLVKRTLTFQAFTTDRIRVNVTNALAGYARITEIEAWGH